MSEIKLAWFSATDTQDKAGLFHTFRRLTDDNFANITLNFLMGAPADNDTYGVQFSVRHDGEYGRYNLYLIVNDGLPASLVESIAIAVRGYMYGTLHEFHKNWKNGYCPEVSEA